ncbi:hypothetical protein GCK32_021454 [Trichostrongylus colubriformis]|uniref:Uncharacterized protein n=1 Tax=Trichostrongylus colubriformis TaxID=6319 RepID=A0AAN8F4U2_TRICO
MLSPFEKKQTCPSSACCYIFCFFFIYLFTKVTLLVS